MNLNNITATSAMSKVRLTKEDREVAEFVLKRLEKLIYKMIHGKFLRDKVRKTATVEDVFQYVATRITYIIGKHHYGTTIENKEDVVKICKREAGFSINDWFTLNTKADKHHTPFDFQSSFQDHDSSSNFNPMTNAVMTALYQLETKKDLFKHIEIKCCLTKQEQLLYEYVIEGNLLNFTVIKQLAFPHLRPSEYDRLVKSFKKKLKQYHAIV